MRKQIRKFRAIGIWLQSNAFQTTQSAHSPMVGKRCGQTADWLILHDAASKRWSRSHYVFEWKCRFPLNKHTLFFGDSLYNTSHHERQNIFDENFLILAGLEPAIPWFVVRCLIHWATGPYIHVSLLCCTFFSTHCNTHCNLRRYLHNTSIAWK